MSKITPGQIQEVVDILEEAMNGSYQIMIHSEHLFGNIPFVITLKQKVFNNIYEAKMKLMEIENSMNEISEV